MVMMKEVQTRCNCMYLFVVFVFFIQIRFYQRLKVPNSYVFFNQFKCFFYFLTRDCDVTND